MTAEKILQSICCFLSGATVFLFGEDPITAFKFLLALMVIDYITGVMAAAYKHDLSSKIGFKGIIKKTMILILIIVGHLTDTYMIGKGNPTMTVICVWFCSNEGLSIYENARKVLGEKKMPKALMKYFKNLAKDEKGEDNTDEETDKENEDDEN